MAFEVTLVPKENIELGVTEKAVFTLSNVTPTIPVPGPKGDKGDKGDTGPQGPQGLPGTGVNTTDDIPEGDTNLYYTDERVEGVIAANVVLATGTNSGLISSSDFTKLQGIASGAEVNVNADWNAISGDAQILNKPTIISSVSANSPITSSGGTTPVISTSMTTNRLIGRGSAGTGAMEEISIGSGLQLSGTTLSATGGGAGSGITKATASGTDTYTASVTGFANYSDGDTFLIRFTNGNTTGATLNINSLGAKTLYNNNDGALIGGDITAGSEMLCIFNTTLNGFQVIGTSPNSLFAYVTNAESTTITKGQPVYAFGGTGDRLTVKLAYNTGDSTSAQTIGLVLSDSIGANQKGIIIVQGAISGLSLFPTSTWSDGDAVYLGATAGTLTKTKPSAPNHLVYLGFVTTASNGAAGRMYVRVQNGYELQELHNVALSNTPTNNDGLFYESATSLWKNKSIPTVLGYTPEPTITAGTTGQYYRGDKTFQTLDKTAVGLSNVDNTSDANKPISSATQTALNAKLNTSLKGANNGLAELDSSGKVPTSQLPSYVDDVLEYANIGSLPATGSAGIIYVTLDDNKIYRWSGTAYVVISDTIALGETSATAYRGDRGKTAYDHSQIITGNPHGTTKADIGLGNVDNTSDATKNSAAVSLTNKIIDCSLNTLSNIAQSSVTNLTTDLAGKVAANTAITGATKTKITYDTKGLVTAGADATTADIADSTNKRYVTDAQLTVIGNTSGTNTGDQNTFGTIAVAGQSNVVADATNDTLTLIAGTGVSITTNASTDAITINSSTNLSLDDITASGTINILNDNGTGVSIPLATSIGSGIISASNFDKLTALSTARQIPPLGSTGQVLGKVSGTDYAVGWIDNVVDGSVTFAKMANISTNTLIGRATAGTGVPESIGIGSFMSLSGGILFNTLAVGSGSNQTIIGGANASGTLTLSSTSNATKGKILFGASAYDEVNDRLGINQATPTARLQINNNQNSVTQSDANGILLANSTAATNGTQSVSPPIVWQGNSWATTPAASQDVRYRMFLWPNQGSTAGRGELTIQAFVSGTLQNSWAFSENGIFRGNHINGLLSLYSNNISAGVQMQSIGLNGFSLFQYRTTNGGADISPQIIGGVFGSTAGILTYGIDSTNGITFNAANGTRSITRASINIANLTNTAGSESGDLIFLTQSGGTAASEKFRINSTGNVGINQTNPTSKLHINFNQNSVTQNDANGILLANSTAAINGTQSVSPPIVWQGNSWATTPAASQDVRYRMFLWPNQGSTAGRGELTIQAFVSGTLQNSWAFSENGIFRGNHINGLLSLYSNNISAGVQMQSIGLNGFSLFQYRTTNGGADISPQIIGGVFGSTAGILTYGIDSTNGITFNAANGTRSITRASINIANLNNTAGSESGDLIFLTQSGGTAASEKFRISSGGNFTFFDGGNFILGTTTGTKIGTATSQKIGFWNATPIIQPTTGVAAATLVSNAGTALTSTDTFDGYTLQQIVKALRNIGILA